MRRVLGAFAVIVVLLGLGRHRTSRMPHPARSCRSDPVARACEVSTGTGAVVLDADQMANAATIAAVGIRAALPDRAVVVALATALQESELKNLDGGDRDSVGLFQQRPSQGWGSAEELRDPRYAARSLLQPLVKVPGLGGAAGHRGGAAGAAQRLPRGVREVGRRGHGAVTQALIGQAPGAVTAPSRPSRPPGVRRGRRPG